MLLLGILLVGQGFQPWMIGPFAKADSANPILRPLSKPLFDCPMVGKPVAWEANHVFNPAAVVRNGKIYVLFRAEDETGTGVGGHTSRIGLAESVDGLHFTRRSTPVLFPAVDSQKSNEWDGGCEDPRIVERPGGGYVLTYTQWNRKTARLAVATSNDLVRWTKHGYIFADAYGGRFKDQWSKSGSIVTRRIGDHLVAAKIGGKYWMYWGEKFIYVATSPDLVHWTPLLKKDGSLDYAFGTREGKFDSDLVEPGPPAVLTQRGIVFLYNGKNAAKGGEKSLRPGAYAAGQALLDPKNPKRLLQRCSSYFFRPERPYEMTGQYAAGTVFIEGLVSFKKKWFLYYGTADSLVAVATTAQKD